MLDLADNRLCLLGSLGKHNNTMLPELLMSLECWQCGLGLSVENHVEVCVDCRHGSEARECCDRKIKKRVSNCPAVYRSKSKDNP